VTGFTSALETFCGQAYGAGHYRALGVSLQRAVILISLVTVGVGGLWLHADRLLLALHQDPKISAASARYVQLLLPALWLSAVSDAFQRYLMTQVRGPAGRLRVRLLRLQGPGGGRLAVPMGVCTWMCSARRTLHGC
jgi:hypothetical protein